MMYIAGRGKARRTHRMLAPGREDPLAVKVLKGLAVPVREEVSLQSSERDNAPAIVAPDKSAVPLFEPFRFPG